MDETVTLIVAADLGEIVASYPRIDVPTHKDRIISPRNGAALRTKIPRAEPLTVDDCGHVPHEEAPCRRSSRSCCALRVRRT